MILRPHGKADALINWTSLYVVYPLGTDRLYNISVRQTRKECDELISSERESWLRYGTGPDGFPWPDWIVLGPLDLSNSPGVQIAYPPLQVVETPVGQPLQPPGVVDDRGARCARQCGHVLPCPCHTRGVR